MELTQKSFQLRMGDDNLIAKIIIVVLLLNVLIIAFSFPILTNDAIKQSMMNNSGTNAPSHTIENSEIMQNANNFLSGFTDGFIAQTITGKSNINYILQSPAMTIGFGQSSVKIAIQDDISKQTPSYTTISENFLNSNQVNPEVADPINSQTIYFIGSSVGTTRQAYATLWYRNIYNLIDLEYTIKDGNLKYNFFVYPGGNPHDIQMKWQGPVTIEKNLGNLLLTVRTSVGQKTLIDKAPIAYQQSIDNSPAIDFAITGENVYSFEIKDYNPNEILIIDPTVMLTSTILGGQGTDNAVGVKVDLKGYIYVTGQEDSFDFPQSFSNTSNQGNLDVFVMKISPDGNNLVFSAVIGGSNNDFAGDLGLDSHNNIYVTGSTQSTDFPTTPGAVNRTFGGSTFDTFVFRLSYTGQSLIYSTYVGGEGDDVARGLYVFYDAVYVTGYTNSSLFPLISSYQSLQGFQDAFVYALSPTGSLAFSSLFGGSGNADEGSDIAVDPSGFIKVVGVTDSFDFPTTLKGTTFAGGIMDAFFIKIDISGSLLFSTLLGGTSDEYGYGIAIDNNYNVYITGFTVSNDFPTTANAFNKTFGGTADVFITKYNSSDDMVYSSYLGGSGDDEGIDIAVGSDGSMYIVGRTYSNDFPNYNGFKSSFTGNSQGFVTKISSDGTSLLYSSYLGGDSYNYANAISVDSLGNAFVTGFSQSNTFPYYSDLSGSLDFGNGFGFVTKIGTVSLSDMAVNNLAVFKTSTNTFDVSWDTPTVSDSIQQYYIFRSTTSDSGVFFSMGYTTDTHFLDQSVTPGVTYIYKITPQYAFGAGTESIEVNATIYSVASAPTIQLTTGNRSVYVSWTGPSSDGGSVILEYQIYRGTQTGQYEFVGVTNNLYFNDTNLSGGTQYFYVVCAVTSAGKGDYSVEKTATPFGQASYDKIVTVTTTISSPVVTTTVSEGPASTDSSTSSSQANSPGFEMLSLVALFFTVSLLVIFKRKNH